jgi:hypothetical protein
MAGPRSLPCLLLGNASLTQLNALASAYVNHFDFNSSFLPHGMLVAPDRQTLWPINMIRSSVENSIHSCPIGYTNLLRPPYNVRAQFHISILWGRSVGPSKGSIIFAEQEVTFLPRELKTSQRGGAEKQDLAITKRLCRCMSAIMLIGLVYRVRSIP